MGEIQSETSSSVIEWYTSEATTPTHTAPSEPLAVFVGSTYGNAWERGKIRFLDIGSGSGANTRYLLDEGYNCVAIDASDDAYAHHHLSIDDYLPDPELVGLNLEHFDCIFDINTLCHVENPPYEKIYAALKPGGKFFSIHPAHDTEVDISGKGYTRLADALTMRRLLTPPFYRPIIHKTVNWRRDTKITAWQIEAVVAEL